MIHYEIIKNNDLEKWNEYINKIMDLDDNWKKLYLEDEINATACYGNETLFVILFEKIKDTDTFQNMHYLHYARSNMIKYDMFDALKRLDESNNTKEKNNFKKKHWIYVCMYT